MLPRLSLCVDQALLIHILLCGASLPFLIKVVVRVLIIVAPVHRWHHKARPVPGEPLDCFDDLMISPLCMQQKKQRQRRQQQQQCMSKLSSREAYKLAVGNCMIQVIITGPRP